MKINSSTSFYFEDTAFSGVHKIAEKVMHDIELVTGTAPAKGGEDSTVIFGTVGKSAIIENLEKEGKIDLSEVKGKREVYGFYVLENQIVIAGSDKRGTIYGLFHLSELLGVSPLVDWCNIKPVQKAEVEITSDDTMISKEPSVRFRGFFINDEWPAFGNWSGKNFGGVNAKCYEHVFELLLRLKGNYLWPAMWASRFSDDGPGLLNAELADELGVVMGASHHEPCCRAGEEYKYLRGPDSIYGDAWNFIKNEKGITKFWEDGLKRNGKFDNVITVGMRGEADTAIMQNATLKDNIDLLRNVLKTQNRLIRENVNQNLEEVPRMLALYKEVEPYFYGDKKTKGLMGDPELDNVILMLCDDNHGNLRTVPTKEMRKHKGGYGMYYHFDYHGSPFSYEWINTTHLAKVREQMCAAYDFGIQDLWIVNVGDILTNEFPLSYFLDLAYDYEKYSDFEMTAEKYTRQWVSKQFPDFSKEQQDDVAFILNGYTKLSHRRRTEALNAETYHPVNYGESDETLALAEDIMNRCKKLKGEVSEKDFSGFFAQVYYPAMGNMNVLKMQLLAGKNHWYASNGILAANDLVPEIKKCIEFDHALVKELDAVDGGKYYGQGWSQHIGFKHWNEEENQYPVYMTVEPADKKRLCVWVEGNDEVTSGLDWTKRRLYSFAFQDPECKSFVLNIGTASNQTIPFRLECDRDWISFSQKEGDVSGTEIKKIEVFVDREKLEKDNDKGCYVFVTNDDRSAGGVKVPVFVEAGTAQWVSKVTGCEIPENTICQKGPYISIDAADFSESFAGTDTEGRVTGFEVLPDYGKLNSAVKVESVTSYFREDLKDAPCLKYNFFMTGKLDGILKVDFYMNPSNPATQDNYFRFGAAVNGKKVLVDCVDENFHVGDNQEPWGTDVTNNIRVKSAYFECKEGFNTLEVYAVTPNFVLEKIVMYTTDSEKFIKSSYLGPR
ncbi:MAG: glycosyl hydrolase 115 family protein [Treponema sp.]|nr:glycosyl hydrolase 115 family protein [Treponema sp.]